MQPTNRFPSTHAAAFADALHDAPFQDPAFHRLPGWVTPGMRTLDCGCGRGTLTSLLADIVFPARVTGIDLPSPTLDTARRLAEGREQVNLDFREAPVQTLPYADGIFDLVHARGLLEQLSDPLPALSEMRRVLRPGHRLLLASLDWESSSCRLASSAVEGAMRRCKALLIPHPLPEPLGQSVESLLQAAGFADIQCDTQTHRQHPPLPAATWFASLLQTVGERDAAAQLLRWAVRPGAAFRWTWRFWVGSANCNR